MLPKRIVSIGASSCEGKVDPKGGGFVGRLRRWLESIDQHYHVYNLGVSGDTTSGMLKRFLQEAKPRKPELVIIMLGINDCRRDGSKNSPCDTPTSQFRENVSKLITQARSLTDKVLFISVYPIDESKTAPVSWRKVFYLEKDAGNYAGNMKQICKELKIDYLDIFNVWLKENYKNKYLADDGLHANSRGHEYIFEKVKDCLVKKYK